MEKNQHIPASSLSEYLRKYSVTLCNALDRISPLALAAAYELIAECAKRRRRIFVCGNGGSAAISEHLFCDFAKSSGINVVSLSGSSAMLTALANDYGVDSMFNRQLNFHRACKDELLILISSSGRSANILNALTYAKLHGMPSIGITGFDGGPLRQRCDVSLHVEEANYGIAEDAAQALMHVLSQWHARPST